MVRIPRFLPPGAFPRCWSLGSSGWGWGLRDPRELTCLSAFFPSTYAPVKPFLRVDKEKVRGACPNRCNEHPFGHGPCHPIFPRGPPACLGAPSWGADAKGSVAGAPAPTPARPPRYRSTTLPSSSTSMTAGQSTTGATPPPACWCFSSPSTSVTRWVMAPRGPCPGCGVLGGLRGLRCTAGSWLAWDGFAGIPNLAGLRREAPSLGPTAAVPLVPGA